MYNFNTIPFSSPPKELSKLFFILNIQEFSTLENWSRGCFFQRAGCETWYFWAKFRQVDDEIEFITHNMWPRRMQLHYVLRETRVTTLLVTLHTLYIYSHCTHFVPEERTIFIHPCVPSTTHAYIYLYASYTGTLLSRRVCFG